MTPFDDFVYLINHVLLGEEPQERGPHRQFTCKIIQNPIKAFDASTSTDDAPIPGGGSGIGSSMSNMQYNGSSGSGSYSKNGTVAMHNYYVKNGHHCCT
ncbi:uncharacterized protein LOC6740291 isoform X3 [Drosophila simulans]|uniref:uncharacterized protein LOC6740291 isoform X3 n=1 Tax=Drosophila simulans TaxID=7240 RepID=UPI001D0FEF5C|nr:uncharacterized protein LOC6740291 isoform X3 [Drosophila simulans]